MLALSEDVGLNGNWGMKVGDNRGIILQERLKNSFGGEVPTTRRKNRDNGEVKSEYLEKGFQGSYSSDSETNFTPPSNLRKRIRRKRHNQSRKNKLNNPQG